MSNRILNFSPGPAALPEEVLEQARADIWNLDGSGIGVLEHSHRGKAIDRIFDEAQADCRELLGLPESYAVLFLQGGASTQFAMVPANFLPEGGTADYLNTGAWSKKAIAEAKLYGGVHEAASSADSNFSYIPNRDQTSYSAEPAYVHFTSNNTIFGTQFVTEPEAPSGSVLVCDMSSDVCSRPLDPTRYGVIYAGAQKNLGPSGLTLVVIRRDLLDKAVREVPSMFRYHLHESNGSRYNTPSVFGVYMVGRVFRWILDSGGLSGMAERNAAKAKLIYDYIDGSSAFYGTARADSRSLMNITFRAPTEDLEKKFIAEAESEGLSGLKGHRSVGGMRASIYNAFPPVGCEALVQFMKHFESRNG